MVRPANSRCVTSCMLSAIAEPTGTRSTKLSAAVILTSAFDRWRNHRIAERGVIKIAELVSARCPRGRRACVVGADLADQALFREHVPLIAAQIHALLRLEVSPFEHRLEPCGVDDETVNGPHGTKSCDRLHPPFGNRPRALERALRCAAWKVMHALGLEAGADLFSIRFVAGIEIFADRGFEPGGRRVSHWCSPGCRGVSDALS